ncbi:MULTISPECIES: MFS transporter [unclassified Pseudomonas]|uniref:MFS transporter n=1 Tax=unclassified Pseudomonas TaxID=196821 RepID=UPI0008394D28|nr:MULTISPECIES: MFS transporter [unclassified Pseudomonas]QIH09544.1 MFS transporter [Pseudomonas sp. BIOMIG1BAC]UMZ09759.1 MFS transporter [Pseudomonas sp. MPFS]
MHQRTQNPCEIIDRSPVSALQIRVLLLCFLILVMDGFDTAAIGYIAPELIRNWGIERAQLAPAFGAGLFGMLLGSFCFGPLADRLGRKSVLLICVLIFALGTLASALSPSIEVLAGLRCITGIGLGGVLPNCITLSSEYSPARRRMLLVTLSYSGFTLGLALGGGVAGALLPTVGWQGLLVIGGIAPLLLWPVLYFALPESVCFMANNPRHAVALRRIVERISGETDWQQVRFAGDAPASLGRSPLSALFSQGQMTRTLLLWLTFFCCLLVFYLLTSWLPTVLHASGYNTANAARISAMIPFGGVLGGIAMALLMDRIGALRILPWLCLGAAAALALTGSQLHGAVGTLVIVFLAGFSLTGTLNNLSVVAATLYPTASRATGVAWALAAGRAGSITGSMLGGWIFSNAGSLEHFFLWIATPVLLAGLALGLMNRIRQKPQAEIEPTA